MNTQVTQPTFEQIAEKWAKCDHWTLEDAVHLLSELAPKVFQREPLDSAKKYQINIRLAFARNHAKESLPIINPSAPENDYRVKPIDFLKWAQIHGLSVPLSLQIPFEKVTQRQIGRTQPQLRNSQRHRERCFAIAALLWSQSPETTIATMAQREEILKYGCEDTGYQQDTIEDWIRSACPAPRAGRPKAK